MDDVTMEPVESETNDELYCDVCGNQVPKVIRFGGFSRDDWEGDIDICQSCLTNAFNLINQG